MATVPTYWTLSILESGEEVLEQTFAAWGFSKLKRKRRSLIKDVATFEGDGALYDSQAKIKYRQVCIIRQGRVVDPTAPLGFSGGQSWFYGLMTNLSRNGTSKSESLSYELSGPGWYFENLVFEKKFVQFAGWKNGDINQGPTFTDVYSSHCYINLNSDASITVPGDVLSIGEQMAEALNWAIFRGALFQFSMDELTNEFGGLDTPPGEGVYPPIDEKNDLLVSDVLKQQLRWSPDAKTWFDYTTIPPTFHALKRASLSQVTLDLTAGNLIIRNQIKARYDLQVPQVLLKYLYNNTQDGHNWVSVFVDQYPPQPGNNEFPDGVSGFSALVATIDLQGQVGTTLLGNLQISPINLTDPSWWLNTCELFQGVGITIQQISNFTTTSTLNLPNELLSSGSGGGIASWMRNSGSYNPVKSEEINVTAVVDYTDAAGNVLKSVPIQRKFMSTDAAGGQYEMNQISQYAENYLTYAGLAEQIYIALNTLNYEGSIVLTEDEVSGAVDMSNVLNLSNGLAAETEDYDDITVTNPWLTMNASIQEIEEDVDNGTTTITFGPNKYLSAGELVDLLRINRNRLILENPTYTISGESSGNSFNLPQAGTSNRIQTLIGGTEVHVTSSTQVAGTGNEIIKDARSNQFTIQNQNDGLIVAAYTDAQGQQIRFRWVCGCVKNSDGSSTSVKFMCWCGPPVAI